MARGEAGEAAEAGGRAKPSAAMPLRLQIAGLFAVLLAAVALALGLTAGQGYWTARPEQPGRSALAGARPGL